MSFDNTTVTARKPLRLWPGVALAVIVLIMRFVVPVVVPSMGIIGVLGGLAGGVLILLWWLFFSRARWSERLGAVAIIAIAAVATKFLVHPSIAGGMMGNMLPVFLLPATVGIALVAWAAMANRWSGAARWVTMTAAIVAGCGVWVLARTDGVKGAADAQLAWRWTPTAEERLLAQTTNETLPAPAPAAPVPAPAVVPSTAKEPAATTGDKPAVAVEAARSADASAAADPDVLRVSWDGFRGPNRDGVVKGIRLNTDWSAAAPVEIWRRKVGPGWSSFAVAGDLIFTQEQRGEHELVSAHRLRDGAPVWRHQDRARFYESNGGPGPRGTPTVQDGRVYTMGATGIVNALDARTGAVRWTRNAETDTGAPRPGWGFTASPVVIDDILVTATSGRLAAYELANGAVRWTLKTGNNSYSSPHAVTLDGVRQIVLQNGGGATGIGLDGTILWEAKGPDAVGIVQPTALDEHSLLVAPGDAMGGIGLRRVAVSRNADGTWKAEDRWTSRGLKPYFNDYIVHKGHAYGFDGTIMAAVNLDTGERVWKGGRYGAGQVLLIADQDLLLVVSEDGELVLVSATPEKHNEIAKFKAIEGKTWNHPVLVGDTLLVRNGEEMAAFRLPVERR